MRCFNAHTFTLHVMIMFTLGVPLHYIPKLNLVLSKLKQRSLLKKLYILNSS